MRMRMRMKTKYVVYSIWYIGITALAIYLLPLISLYTTYDIPYTVSAEEASPGASVKEKIEALKKEVASKAAQLKTEVNKDLQNRAYVGTVKSINSEEITLETLNGSKTVKVNEYTAYLDETKSTKAKLDVKSIKEDMYIAALGDVDDKLVLTAIRVVISKPVEIPQYSYFWGQVQKIAGGNVTIKPRNGTEITVSTLGTTTYQLGTEEASFIDVKVNKYLAGIGSTIQDKKTQAKFLYLIPSTGYVRPEKKVASPSATPANNE